MMVPITSPMAIHWYDTIPCWQSVPAMASTIPSAAWFMPRRARSGCASERNPRMKNTDATR